MPARSLIDWSTIAPLAAISPVVGTIDGGAASTPSSHRPMAAGFDQ